MRAEGRVRIVFGASGDPIAGTDVSGFDAFASGMNSGVDVVPGFSLTEDTQDLTRDGRMVDDLAVDSVLLIDENGDGVADGSLTLPGVGLAEMDTLIEANLVLADGSTRGNV